MAQLWIYTNVRQTSPLLAVFARNGIYLLNHGRSVPALFARTNFAQEFPRVNAQVVVVVPRELYGISPHALCRKWLRVRFKDQQRPRGGGCRIPRVSSGLAPFLLAHSARTCVPQINKAIMRNVPIPPLDVHPSPCGEMHLDRLRVSGSGRRL